MNPSRYPPGPRGSEMLRTVVGRRRDPVRLLEKLRSDYGDIVHIRVGDTHQYLVSDLDLVKHVLVDNGRNYTKGPAYDLLAAALGRGLVTSEGELWRTRRRQIQPLLQRERMAGFAAGMVAGAREAADRLRNVAEREGEIDIYALMMEVALRIVARTLLGEEIRGRETEIHDAFTEVLDRVEGLSASPLRILELLPGGSRLRSLRRLAAASPTRERRAFEGALLTLDTIIYDVIGQRRRALHAGAPADDLVSMLLTAASQPPAVPLSDQEVRDEVITIFLAGHDTVATGLAWCLYLLSLHPSYQATIAEEAERVLAGDPPTMATLPRLAATNAIFQESMRLYPPVWRISRFAAGPDELGGYRIAPGSVVIVSPYLIHRHLNHWPEPEAFRPERFTEDASRERPRLAFMPFGAGQRMCPGGGFADVEAQIVLSTVLRAVRFEPPIAVPEFEPRLTLRPRGGLTLKVRSRVPAGVPVLP